MKITAMTKPHAKENKIEKMDEEHYRVFVKAPAEGGAANQAVLEVLSDYFKKPVGAFTILSGHQSRKKVIAWQ